jgi:hypothetical protein
MVPGGDGRLKSADFKSIFKTLQVVAGDRNLSNKVLRQAHVFYPEAQADRCTAAVLLEVDSIALPRGRGGPSGEGGQLQQYVNDRPYAANHL